MNDAYLIVYMAIFCMFAGYAVGAVAWYRKGYDKGREIGYKLGEHAGIQWCSDELKRNND